MWTWPFITMCNVRFNTKRAPRAAAGASAQDSLSWADTRTSSCALLRRTSSKCTQWSTVDYYQVGTILTAPQTHINIAHPSHRPPPAAQRVRPAQGRWGCTSPLLRHTPLLTESQCVTWEHASRGVSRSGGCMPSLLGRHTSGGNDSIGETEWAHHSHRRYS